MVMIDKAYKIGYYSERKGGTMENKVHNYAFDILRILACFLVIVNHTNSEVFLGMQPSLTWALSLAYFYFSKIAVPIFLMISGALLLRKDYSYKDLLLKKVGRIAAVLVLFSLYIYLIEEGNALNLHDFINRIIEAPIITSYWYFYMLLGAYLILPFLRKIVIAMKANDWLYFFIGWALFSGLLPILVRYEVIPTISFWFDVQIMSSFIGYMFMGYYITQHQFSDKAKKIGWLLTILAIITILPISVYSGLYELKTWGQMYLMLDNLYYLTTMIMAVLVFFSIYTMTGKVQFKGMFGKALSGIASTTFGIYVVHMIYNTHLTTVRYEILYFNNRLISVVLYEIFLFAFCALAAWCLKKVPLLKHLFD